MSSVRPRMPVAVAGGDEAAGTEDRPIDRRVDRNNSSRLRVDISQWRQGRRVGASSSHSRCGRAGRTPVVDVNDAEARCLIYEVMTDPRATGKYDSKPVDIARKVASRCALMLKAPR